MIAEDRNTDISKMDAIDRCRVEPAKPKKKNLSEFAKGKRKKEHRQFVEIAKLDSWANPTEGGLARNTE